MQDDKAFLEHKPRNIQWAQEEGASSLRRCLCPRSDGWEFRMDVKVAQSAKLASTRRRWFLTHNSYVRFYADPETWSPTGLRQAAMHKRENAWCNNKSSDPSFLLWQVIPIYGRGCEAKDPRKQPVVIPTYTEDIIPRRPQGQRPALPQVRAFML